jgi:hypothetical protein
MFLAGSLVSCVVATPSCESLVCCEQRPVAGEDGCASCETGRDRGWAPEQLTHMAEEYVTTTTDPIVTTDQTSETFQANLVHPQRHMRSHSPVPSALPQYAAAGEYTCPERPASGQKSASKRSFSNTLSQPWRGTRYRRVKNFWLQRRRLGSAKILLHNARQVCVEGPARIRLPDYSKAAMLSRILIVKMTSSSSCTINETRSSSSESHAAALSKPCSGSRPIGGSSGSGFP